MDSTSPEVNALHAAYCAAMGIDLPLNMTFERWWISAVLAGVTPEHVELCVAGRKKFNASSSCKKGLELKHLIRDEDNCAVLLNEVAVLIADRRRKVYPAPKAQVLREAHRPDVPPPRAGGDAKPIGDYLATLRQALEGKESK